MSKEKVWVVTGHSESGDDFGPFVFSKEPDNTVLEAIAYFCDGDEDRDGPGDFGSYTLLSVSDCEIDREYWNE